MTTRILVLGAALVAGCAWQSEAQKIGEDTYQVSAKGVTSTRRRNRRTSNGTVER